MGPAVKIGKTWHEPEGKEIGGEKKGRLHERSGKSKKRGWDKRSQSPHSRHHPREAPSEKKKKGLHRSRVFKHSMRKKYRGGRIRRSLRHIQERQKKRDLRILWQPRKRILTR